MLTLFLFPVDNDRVPRGGKRGNEGIRQVAVAEVTRRGGVSTLDYYDIPSNSWTSAVSYLRAQETFTTGSSSVSLGGKIYLQQNATGRFFRYDPVDNRLDSFSTLLYAQSTAILGNKCFSVTYTDGATTLQWVYNLRNTGTELFRCLVI